MRQYATFGRVGNKFDLIAGPNADREGQKEAIKGMIVAGGNGKHEEVLLVNIKSAPEKRRRLDPKKGGSAPSKKAAK